MASVKLEILRGGPPHNHLLSPLTSYLALCGDHTSSTLNVPFEHAQLLERLRALGYSGDPTGAEGERRRRYEIVELGRLMGEVLEQVPGLVKDMADSVLRDGDLTHLRLVLSANELALMPFELAIGPAAFPGTGDALFLQSVSPVCVTREIRRAAAPSIQWPLKPKVLFVSASPVGTSAVPLEAHLLALRQAVDPWVHHYRDDNEKKRRAKVAEHLDVLPEASVQAIAEACATGAYSHVHILAHGVPMTFGDDRHFGLALHDRLEPQRLDPVDGARLAAALRPHVTDGDRSLARPVLVTLATCDSANTGGVVAPGSSIAHDLHRAGIPLVVASQFPLSFEGSVHLVRLLYQPLLWGEDPRLVMHDVRCQLAARVRSRHDWASLVTYADLPADLDYQLREVTFDQARRAIEATMSHLDSMLDDMSGHGPQRSALDGSSQGSSHASTATINGESPSAADVEIDLAHWHARAKAPLERLDKVRGKLEHLRSRSPDQLADIAGLLASAQKRLAEFWSRMALRGKSAATTGALAAQNGSLLRDYHRRAERCLREAEQHYEDAFAAKGYSWALVQAMALSAARNREVNPESWQLAWLLSKREEQIHPKHDDRKYSAINNLIELCLLSKVKQKTPSAPISSTEITTPSPSAAAPRLPSDVVQDPEGEAKIWLQALLGLQMLDQSQARSLRRQLIRYAETFNMDENVKNAASSLLAIIDTRTHAEPQT